MTECWLSDFWEHECEPPFDRAHLGLTKQFLRRKGLSAVCRDPRIWRWCCRAAHHRLDNGFIRLKREDLPASVEDFADEFGLSWRLDRDYGVREALSASESGQSVC